MDDVIKDGKLRKLLSSDVFMNVNECKRLQPVALSIS